TVRTTRSMAGGRRNSFTAVAVAPGCIIKAIQQGWRFSMTDCPKCRGRMTQGYAYMPDLGSRVKWMDGEPGFWKALTSGFRMKASELSARRCTQCGFVEFF